MTVVRARGLTLIELLVALALTLVVTALLFVSFHAVRRTLDRIGRDSPSEAAGRLLDRFADRLSHATSEGVQGRAFKVTADSSDGSSRLLFHSPWTPDGWPIPTNAPSGLCRLEYWVDPDGGRGLLQSLQPLRGPGAGDPPVTNVFDRNTTRLVVKAWDGKDWTTEWPAAEQDSGLPSIIRLKLESRSRTGIFSREADLPIPAGWLIKSRLERQAAPATP